MEPGDKIGPRRPAIVEDYDLSSDQDRTSSKLQKKKARGRHQNQDLPGMVQTQAFDATPDQPPQYYNGSHVDTQSASNKDQNAKGKKSDR